MKKLLLILLCLPMIGFGKDNENHTLNKQNILLGDSNDDALYSQLIDIHPFSLLFGKVHIAYERAIFNNQSIKIGIPLYLKRDISKIRLVRNIASFYDVDFYDNDDPQNSTLNDILDDAGGLAYFMGHGVSFEYRFYLNKYKEVLSGIYISPEYSFKKFNLKVDINASDIEHIMQTHNDPSIIPHNYATYQVDAESKINSLGLKFGHQWTTESLSFDLNFAVSRSSIKYNVKEEITYLNTWSEPQTEDIDGNVYYFLPKIEFSIGYKF